MTKRPQILRGTVAAALVGGVVLACYGPTEVVLELRTDLHARNPRTLIKVGGTTATKDGATGDGRIGELVLVPSDKRDAIVDVAVVTSVDGRSPDECESSPDKTGCVFARRRFKFSSHESRSFVVFMSSVCLGKDCGTQTCEDGVCVAPSENKSDGNPGGEPIPPAPTPDATTTDGAVADVQTDGPVDPLCPPDQRLVTGATSMVPGTLQVNAARLHWVEASKTPTIAYMPNTPGATNIEHILGDTFSIDANTIVSTLSTNGTLRRTTFGAGVPVSQECPTGGTGGVALLGGANAGIYVTQSGVIQRVTGFDPGGCVMTPFPVEKGTFRELWPGGISLYANTDDKTLNRVTPVMPSVPAQNALVIEAIPLMASSHNQSLAFVDQGGTNIYVANPIANPKSLEVTLTTANPILGIALDATHVYWLEPQPGALQQNVVGLFRALRGQNATPDLIGRYAEAHTVAADDRCLYVYGREIARGLNARTGLFARPKTWISSVKD